MSDQDIEKVEEDEVVKPTEEPKENVSERLMQHLDRQAQLLEQREEELRSMREQIASFGQKPVEDPEDDEQVYLTKRQLADMEKRVSEQAEQRASEKVYKRMYEEKVADLHEQLSRPEVNSLAEKILEEDEVFKEMVLSIHKTDPLKAKQMMMKKVKNSMAKKASVPKTPAGASVGSTNAGAAKEEAVKRDVKSINGRSSEDDKLAFAENLYKKILGK
ncbi:MAG: hypothetical protein ACRC6D_05605 [Aeromonas sp.]